MKDRSSIQVFIVDDHPIFRQGLKQVIDSDPRLQVVGEAPNATEALERIKALRPHIALLDFDLPDLNGLQLTQALHRLPQPPHVVILTSYKEESMLNAALDEGVKGYILKENAATDLMNGLKAVAAGEAYLSPSISGFLLQRRERREALRTSQPKLAQLTPMERRVLKLIAQNKTSKQIGRDLFISHRTVETHRANICEKLGLKGSHPLLQFALQHQQEL
jgi:DNA-binding NarL/FixJ family response regulator